MREAREALGLDQIEVSRRLRKAPNYCNRIEAGERVLQIMDLGDLARLYNKPLRYFMPDTPPESGS